MTACAHATNNGLAAVNITTLPEPAPIAQDGPLASAPARPATERLQSLDAYRGLIMLTLLAGSVFGSLKGHPVWNWLYLQNEHVTWPASTGIFGERFSSSRESPQRV